MGKISTIVVDDDRVFQTILAGFIKKTDKLDLIKVFSNPIDAINFLNQHRVDLIFLDIEMPDMTGLQFIKALQYRPGIVLITSKEEYAVKAFEHNVTDYLVKPLEDYSRFLEAVKRVKNSINHASKPEYFFVKVDSKLVRINFRDISYIEAYGDYVKIFVEDKNYITFSTLKSILQKLPVEYFLQVHRSYIIRLDKVDFVEGNNLSINNKLVPFSKKMRDEILGKIIS